MQYDSNLKPEKAVRDILAEEIGSIDAEAHPEAALNIARLTLFEELAPGAVALLASAAAQYKAPSGFEMLWSKLRDYQAEPKPTTEQYLTLPLGHSSCKEILFPLFKEQLLEKAQGHLAEPLGQALFRSYIQDPEQGLEFLGFVSEELRANDGLGDEFLASLTLAHVDPVEIYRLYVGTPQEWEIFRECIRAGKDSTRAALKICKEEMADLELAYALLHERGVPWGVELALEALSRGDTGLESHVLCSMIKAEPSESAWQLLKESAFAQGGSALTTSARVVSLGAVLRASCHISKLDRDIDEVLEGCDKILRSPLQTQTLKDVVTDYIRESPNTYISERLALRILRTSSHGPLSTLCLQSLEERSRFAPLAPSAALKAEYSKTRAQLKQYGHEHDWRRFDRISSLRAIY